MKIHHIRNATMVIEIGDQFILVDPMLGSSKTSAPFAFFKHKAQRNPLVDLPENSMQIINKTTHCLITHLHPDHLDKDAEDFLIRNTTAITCHEKDEKTLQKRGLSILNSLSFWEESSFLNGKIIPIPAKHGYGWVSKLMGNVAGYYITLPNSPSLYISSDTIYTDDVHKVLTELQPDISVLACGSASLDIGKPLLMDMTDLLKFIKNAPGKVLANHMEALNHCPTTREQLRNEIEKIGLIDKVAIPNDGETSIY